MRRLAAILLMLWACVLAPVLPLVAAPSEEPAVCACCKGGPCQHNACPIPAATGSLFCPVEASLRLAPLPVRRSEAIVRRQLKGIVFIEHADVAAQSARAPTRPAELRISVGSVLPLFAVHCSRLI